MRFVTIVFVTIFAIVAVHALVADSFEALALGSTSALQGEPDLAAHAKQVRAKQLSLTQRKKVDNAVAY